MLTLSGVTFVLYHSCCRLVEPSALTLKLVHRSSCLWRKQAGSHMVTVHSPSAHSCLGHRFKYCPRFIRLKLAIFLIKKQCVAVSLVHCPRQWKSAVKSEWIQIEASLMPGGQACTRHRCLFHLKTKPPRLTILSQWHHADDNKLSVQLSCSHMTY